MKVRVPEGTYAVRLFFDSSFGETLEDNVVVKRVTHFQIKDNILILCENDRLRLVVNLTKIRFMQFLASEQQENRGAKPKDLVWCV